MNNFRYVTSQLYFRAGFFASCTGLVLGILAGVKPLLLCLTIAAIVLVICFFTYFKETVIGLLILRSSLDLFSAQQIPAAFAVGLDALTILYIILMLLIGRRVITDVFFWFFAVWVVIQGLWVILLAVGALGLDSSYLLVSIREWVRLFSWLMVYLLVMQLKGIVSPRQFINFLMLSLIAPLTVAAVQVLLPPGMLPSILVYRVGEESLLLGEGSRIFGTLGHPNGFAKFLFLFIALTWWQLDCSKRGWHWIVLLCTLIFFLVTSKALFAIGMFAIFITIRIVHEMSLSKFIAGGVLFVLFIGLFGSSELGLERLNSINSTPLLNPDIDLSQAILMSEGNSFNWRIKQWTYLLQAWQEHPIFGYGLQASSALPIVYSYAHSDYIRALVEGGVVGFITFLVFLGGQMIRLFHLHGKAAPRSDLRKLCSILIAFFIALLLGMATDNVWSNTVVYFYWWSLLAVAGWNWDNSHDNRLIK
jgi:O-antigen ligase